MNSSLARLGFGALLGALLAAPALAKPLSDLASTEKRRTIVEQSQRFVRPAAPAPLPPDLAQPFSPPNFEQPDPEEIKAAEAARARAAASGPQVTNQPATPGAPPPPTGDRDTLENLANLLPPVTGTVVKDGKPRLVFGRKPVEIGSRLTIAYNGQDYEIDLVAVDPPTYTLRYRNEEITRPIKSGKTK